MSALPRLEHWCMLAARKVLATIKVLETGVMPSDVNLVHLSTVYGVAAIAYNNDKPVMTDGTFDMLCKYLLTNFDKAIEQGTAASILQKEMLMVGSGYHLQSWDDVTGYAKGLFDIYTAIRCIAKNQTIFADAPQIAVRNDRPVLISLGEAVELATAPPTRQRPRPAPSPAPTARVRPRPLPTPPAPTRGRPRPSPAPQPVATRSRPRP